MGKFIEVTDTDMYGKPTDKRIVNTDWIYDIRPSADGTHTVIRFSPVSIIEDRAHGITVAENYGVIKQFLHDVIT